MRKLFRRARLFRVSRLFPRRTSARTPSWQPSVGARRRHIGFGALHGNLILGITVVGYNPTPGTIIKLRSLAREEEAAAKVP